MRLHRKGGDRLIARTMNVIGAVFAITILALAGLMLASGASVSLGAFDDVVALYQEGTWIEQVQYRLANFLPPRMEAILVIPTNVFLFLLGIRFMRSGVFSPDENGKGRGKGYSSWAYMSACRSTCSYLFPAALSIYRYAIYSPR